MKEFLKDYGPLIGPFLAFTLGLIAIYIKFYIDRRSKVSETVRKVAKFGNLMTDSLLDNKNKLVGNIEQFAYDNKYNVLKPVIYIVSKDMSRIIDFAKLIETDVYLHCASMEIDVFQQIKDAAERRQLWVGSVNSVLSSMVVTEEGLENEDEKSITLYVNLILQDNVRLKEYLDAWQLSSIKFYLKYRKKS